MLALSVFLFAYRSEDLFRQKRENRVLKFLIVHISRYDFIILRHPLNHQRLDCLPYAEFKLVYGVGFGGLNNLLISESFFFYLLEEESILLTKLSAETLV